MDYLSSALARLFTDTGGCAQSRKQDVALEDAIRRPSTLMIDGHLSSSPLESPQALTKAALSAYKGSALEVNATGGGLEDEQLIRLLGAQMHRKPRVESCHMIINVAQLLARSPRNRSALLLILPHLLSGMQQHLDHEGIQECGLGLVANLAGEQESQSALLRGGCLHHAALCLQRHPDHCAVQRNAYRCLRNATSAGKLAQPSIDFLFEKRVPQLVAFMLHRHIDNSSVVEQALATLWSFACSAPLAAVLSQVAAADAVVRAMARHPDVAEVQRCGCGALTLLLDAAATSTFRSAAQPMPAPAELAPVVLTACRHVDVAAVQTGAMDLLATLARSSRAPALQQAQLEQALHSGVAALSRYATSKPAVVQSACELLEAAVPAPESAHAELVHSQVIDVLPTIFDAVSRFREDIELASAACSLLSTLSSCRALMPALLRCGAVPTAHGVAQRCMHDAEALWHAVQSLRSLVSLSPASAAEQLVGRGGVATMLLALTVHRSLPHVQEACCSLLWSAALLPTPHASLHPKGEGMQVALLPLTRSTALPVRRQLCGLLWTLSLRRQHALALCEPPWMALLAACADGHDAKMFEYAAGTLANLVDVCAEHELELVRRLPLVAIAARGFRRPSLRRHASVRVAASRLLHRAVSLSGLHKQLLRCDAPSMLLFALAESTPDDELSDHPMDDLFELPPVEPDDEKLSDVDATIALQRNAAAALHSMLAMLPSRLLLARAMDATTGSERPSGVQIRSLLSAVALARSWLPAEQQADADGCCIMLPLPLALGVAVSPVDTYRDWSECVAGHAAGSSPCAISGCMALSAGGGQLTTAGGSSADAQTQSSRLEMLAEDVQQLVLTHASVDLRTMLSALCVCSRWRRLMRASDAIARFDLSDYRHDLQSGVLELPRLLALPASGVRALSLSQMAGSALSHLDRILPHCHRLSVLDLSLSSVSGAAIQRFAENSPTLRVLDLAGNGFVNDAVLATVAARCADLRVLCLNACTSVTDNGLICGQWARLRALHLFGCTSVSERGVCALAERCAELACVDLTSSGAANDVAVCSLASARSGALRVIGAGGGVVTDAGVNALATACRTSLEAVFLPNSPWLTPPSRESLRDCPRLRVAIFSGHPSPVSTQ